MTTNGGAGGGAAGAEGRGGSGAAPPGARERPSDLRSSELVSRLLAATPPYLYNMPLVPHSYFFSEMLRSFVHAKNNNETNRLTNQTSAPPLTHRRSRKRSWNPSKISPTMDLPQQQAKAEWQNRQEPWQHRNIQDEKRQTYDEKYPELTVDNNENHSMTYEKPLELTTNKNIIPKHGNLKLHEQQSEREEKHDIDGEVQVKMRRSPKVADAVNHLKDEKFHGGSVPPVAPAIALPPPPPPLWYPPIYPPPYGIDPLNFFIDLRVSGHIYDRKHGAKEGPNININPNQYPGLNPRDPPNEPSFNTQTGPIGFEGNNLSAFKENIKTRHISAFSVPKPRDPNSGNGKHFPINLCHNGSGKFNMKYFDDIDTKVQEKNVTSTHYVMHNLKRIYGDLTEQNGAGNDDRQDDEGKPETSEDLDTGNESDSSETKKKRCKDLRALLGLELVVDYVKTGVRPPDAATESGGSSSDVEVIGEQRMDD